jgi:Bacteriophage tail sheath protein
MLLEIGKWGQTVACEEKYKLGAGPHISNFASHAGEISLRPGSAFHCTFITMATHQTPGVFVEEFTNFPPSVAQVESAIPAFIGYTEKAKQTTDGDLMLSPLRISSLAEYQSFFGVAQLEESIEVMLDSSTPASPKLDVKVHSPSPFLLYYAMKLYFSNGGGACYIVSVGDYLSTISDVDLKNGLDQLRKVDEVTLILFPDAMNLADPTAYYGLCKNAMKQCAELRDRFTILDVWKSNDAAGDNIKTLRDFDFGGLGNAMFAAAYYPRLLSTLPYNYQDDAVTITCVNDSSLSGSMTELSNKNNLYYQKAKDAIANIPLIMPAAPAVAGIYVQIDSTRGVWKAPANVSINTVTSPEVIITNAQQNDLNLDVATGKSINAIRSFPGRGNAFVWGARTLAGNDNEWRYIPVRRFANTVEESCRNSTTWAVFEPNDVNTWTRVQAMLTNYLTLLWRQGALAGAKTSDAFFVHVGLGTSMTAVDISEGRMIVEIGLAVVRPAEFLIVRFSHQMVTS